MTIMAKAVGNDTLPSGTWNLGPVAIVWDVKDSDEIDVNVSILGINVDTLSGTLSTGDVVIKDTVNILGIITGDLSLEAKYATTDNTNGLYLTGQLSGSGFNTNTLNIKLLSW
jgi:hypothetical protein